MNGYRDYKLRDPSDQTEIRLRFDGLVHRMHWDFYTVTACDLRLTIEDASEEYVMKTWASWQTEDAVTCLECLCEMDKQARDVSGFWAQEEVGVGVANIAGIKKLSFEP